MILNRNKLYTLLLIACSAGYIWIYFGITSYGSINQPFEVCLIKHTTDIPCPSCGSTRSVISLTNGNFIEALRINPLGYVIAIILLLVPSWIIIDLISAKKSFYEFYQKAERLIAKPFYAIPLISLLIVNWIWNITKGL